MKLHVSVRTLAARLTLVLAFCVVVHDAHAHGFAGQRFFPATLTIDDSFVNPELDFLYTHDKVVGGNGEPLYLSGLSTEFAQPISHRFELSIGDTYLHMNPIGAGATEKGFDNIEVASKYQVFVHGAAESALAVGLNADLGGTGSARVGAESSSTISPVVYYSKGFGKLSRERLRPLAITAQFAPNFSTDSSAPHTLGLGLHASVQPAVSGRLREVHGAEGAVQEDDPPHRVLQRNMLGPRLQWPDDGKYQPRA